MVISGCSVLERRYPQCKFTPTDDAFRVTCVLKTALVMTKAMIVLLLANVNDKTNEFELWIHVVTVVFLFSFAIMALLTLAFDVRKVWSNPEIVQQAGVENVSGRRFICLYAMSFLSSKAATLLFMASGYISKWLGCDQTPLLYEYHGQDLDRLGHEDGTLGHEDGTECSLCFPGRQGTSANSSVTRRRRRLRFTEVKDACAVRAAVKRGSWSQPRHPAPRGV